MFDPREVGRRIQEQRKQKRLTQEQLAQAVCISVQAVSKWENGESMPNIGTFPALCKTLGASSDALLGIDCEPEIEALGARLARRVSHIESGEERNVALMKVLGYLVSSGDGPWNPDRNVSYRLSENGLTGFGFWSRSGLACFAAGDALAEDVPHAALMDSLRTLLSPGCWSIACALLNGPRRFDSLLEAEVGESSQALSDALRELVQAGLVAQDRRGYRLEEDYGLLLAGMIRALGVASLREDQGRGIRVNSTAD